MMISNIFDAEDLYLGRAKVIMKVLGLWVPQENESILHKIYRFFMLSLQFLFLLFQIVYMILVWGDLEAVSQASYLLFTQACLCFKITVFHVNVNLVKELLRQMVDDVVKPRSDKHRKLLKLQAARIKGLLLAFLLSCFLTCGMWALKPLFDDAGSRKFPFDMWMPVKPEHTGQYLFGYAFQVATINMSACLYYGVDSVCLGMVMFSCAQIEIIKDNILTIKSPAEMIQESVESLSNIARDNFEHLKECIVHHQAIIRFSEQSEDAFHSFLLFQLSGSVGLICMSALRILVIDWQSMQFASIVTYLTVMICQLYVVCWCGHELTATSESLHKVLYKSAWYEQDIKFKRAVCFVMLRMRRPLYIRAGHYITLSRQTFISILRMSYSYIAVLNQTTDKE